MVYTPWILMSSAIFIISILYQLVKNNKRKLLPPGPKGLPIIGHLHLLGKNPHHDLQKLATTHGPIMHLRFGTVDVVVVSSPRAAEQFLKTHDLVFASRPPLQAAKYIAYDQSDISFGQYGPYWRNLRKLCTLQLLSTNKINSFQSVRTEELQLLVQSIRISAEKGAAVDLSARVSSLSADMSCRMVFGKKYMDEEFDERGFKSVTQEVMKLLAAPNLADYFPYLGKLDLQGLTRRMKAVSKVFDEFFERIIDEHVREARRPARDFVDIMLAFMESRETEEFQFDRLHVKAILLDMLAASMDTSATAIEWLLSDLFKNPRVMEKLKKELEETVGKERMVEESDLDSLEYLDMVVKESFRLHPVAPLLIPHEAIEDCTIDGFHIPKKSRIIVNTWAIGRDPNVWRDPCEFIPERFQGSSVDLRGRDFELIPFGSGRRGCPGMQLGLTVVRLVVAQLVHCFEWELPNGMLASELDMTEEFGLVVSRVNHLMAVPKFNMQISK